VNMALVIESEPDISSDEYIRSLLLVFALTILFVIIVINYLSNYLCTCNLVWDQN
jgi:ABC-type phosphate transport system permease subunit